MLSGICFNINLNNPKFIEIDNTYYSGIIIVNYYREYNELILKTADGYVITMILFPVEVGYKILVWTE